MDASLVSRVGTCALEVLEHVQHRIRGELWQISSAQAWLKPELHPLQICAAERRSKDLQQSMQLSNLDLAGFIACDIGCIETLHLQSRAMRSLRKHQCCDCCRLGRSLHSLGWCDSQRKLLMA